MQKLLEGIHRFQRDIFQSHRELFAQLAREQRPDALFITCSDSRINPNLLTQTDPGELFILRNAGNIIPPYGAANGGEGATLEYAVAALDVSEVIVCGHTHCGAVTALLDPEATARLPSVAEWLRHAEATRRIIEEKYLALPLDERLVASVEENVLVQIENLRTHPCVAVRLARGNLHLHAWVYEIETGEVFAYDPDQGQFLPIAEVPPRGPARRLGPTI